MVDDNSMGLGARKAVLEELGYRVCTVGTPQEAMDRLNQDKFDLVITDFKLPGMTGSELIKRMRKQQIPTPVILLSGFVDALGLDEINTGAEVVVSKSAHEVSHLVRAVRSVLRRAPQRKAAASEHPRPGRGPRRKLASE